MAFTDEMIRAAVKTGRYSDAAAEKHIADTLIARRDAIGRTWLTDVNPVIDPALDASGALTFRNAAVDAGVAKAPASYEVAWFTFDNATGRATPIGQPIAAPRERRARRPACQPPTVVRASRHQGHRSPHPSWATPVRASSGAPVRAGSWWDSSGCPMERAAESGTAACASAAPGSPSASFSARCRDPAAFTPPDPAIRAAGHDRRVVATITTLEGTVHMPGIQVELRDPDERIVIAKTQTDGAGQVTFPDVPTGRYLITASGPGFVDRDSTVFVVRANETAQVILDAQLTFVLPGVQVRADDAVTHRQCPTGVDERHAVGIAVRDRAARGRRFPEPVAAVAGRRPRRERAIAHQGRAADPGRAADQQRQPDRSLNGRFRSRSADAERRLRRSHGEPVRRRIWTILHQHHADPHQRRHQRLGLLDRQPGAAVPRTVPRHPRLRAAGSIRGPIRKDRLFLAQDFQFRYVATPVKSLPDEPEVVLRSFDSFTRLDNVMSARHVLSGALILFPREINHVTMNTFRPAATTPDWHSGRLVGRWRRPAGDLAGSGARVHAVASAFRDPGQQRQPCADGLRARDAERRLLQRSGTQRAQLPVGRGVEPHAELWQRPARVQVRHRPAASGYTARARAARSRFVVSMARLRSAPSSARPSAQSVHGTEFAVFAQDRWRVNSRLTFEFGVRVDRDGVGGTGRTGRRERARQSPCCRKAAASCEAGSASSPSARR